MPRSSNSARSTTPYTPLGGRKVEVSSYQQWLFDRDATSPSATSKLSPSAAKLGSPSGATKPTSPFSTHFPPPPRPLRSNSVSLELSLGQSSPTGVGAVLFSPLSDAAGFLLSNEAKAAQLSMSRKDLRHTISCCNQAPEQLAIALAPDCGLAWKQRGVLRLQAGEARAALEERAAAKFEPWDPMGPTGHPKMGIRDYVGAVEDATDAIQAEGVRPEFWRRPSRSRGSRETFCYPQPTTGQALHLDPGHAASWRNRGAARQRIKISHCRWFIEMGNPWGIPRNVHCSDHDLYRLETGDYQGAARDCTQALRMSDQAKAWRNLWVLRAVAKQRLKDLPGAVADLDEAHGVDHGCPGGRGHYEHLIRECNEAWLATCLRPAQANNLQAIPAMPEPGELLLGTELPNLLICRQTSQPYEALRCCRGQAYYRKGDYKSAYDDFESALQHDPESTLARRLLDMSHQCLANDFII
eukprot:Skav223233  [mRNA]  locus=scaffold2231:248467:264231:+ [translate_table: standard]